MFTATLLATTAIEPDCDLEQMRAWIERFKEDEEEEVPATLRYCNQPPILCSLEITLT